MHPAGSETVPKPATKAQARDTVLIITNIRVFQKQVWCWIQVWEAGRQHSVSSNTHLLVCPGICKNTLQVSMQCEPMNPSSGRRTQLFNHKQFSYVKYEKESPTKCFLLKYCWRRTRGLATSIHGTHSKATTTRKHWSPFCKRNKSQVIQLQPLLKHTQNPPRTAEFPVCGCPTTSLSSGNSN